MDQNTNIEKFETEDLKLKNNDQNGQIVQKENSKKIKWQLLRNTMKNSHQT
ncbi:unnamed protein product [Paramecium sonneborni]|uniref:Uncharacterized protein n=1 Tax=Paramecium sonneborni TaxID=65129 RepID=A0A8S1R770_9CILI|nr:unnamed protein product [Paramecium sonneborni]